MQRLTSHEPNLKKRDVEANWGCLGSAQTLARRDRRETGLRLRPLLAGLVLFAAAILHPGSFAFSAPVSGVPLKLAWHPNPESNVAGYEVRYGTASGQYSMKWDAGFQNRVTLPDLVEGETYYIVVVAYNLAGLKSAPSKEIVHRVKKQEADTEPNGTITAPSTDGTIYAGQNVVFSGEGSDPNGNTPLTYRWKFGEGSGIADSQEKNPGEVRFEIPGTYQVSLTVGDSKGRTDPTPDTRTITVISSAEMSVIPRDGWKLKYVDSEETEGYSAIRSFDGDSTTFWHTKFTSGNLSAKSHQIQINLGSVRSVSGFGYLPRQDGFLVGNIGKYEFYVSMDGQFWGKPVATGTFVASPIEKQVVFEPKAGRFIRLVSLKEVNGNSDSNIAELRLFEGPVPNRPPSPKALSISTTRSTAVKFDLMASDPDDNPLTFKILSLPSHGSLTGTPPDLTYTPDSGYTGDDQFSYRVDDGTVNSKPAKVTIRIKPPSAPKSAAIPQWAAPGPANPEACSQRTTIDEIDGLKYLVLTVAKPAIPDDIKRVVQVSPNLVDWFSGSDHTTVIADNERFLRVRDNTPLSPGSKRFIRLKTSSH
jgi:hypothetical protein